ncbi:MAG TPA: hypothetical protein VKX49_13040 [Bryobacteraceae bacterium]|nr:hypothetical protein [Bryobacteraceae bacterium]
MRLRLTILSAAVALLSYGDTLTLRNGRVVHGDYIGGDARHVRFTVGDRVETYSIEDIDNLQFGGEKLRSDAPQPSGFAPEPARAAAPAPARSYDRDRDGDQRPSPQAYAAQIPVGTQITVRMIDAVNSEETRLGQTFRASVDEPVIIGDQTVVPRGADAVVKLVEDRQSGKFEGRTVLTLVLQQVMANGRMVDVTTGDVAESSNSRGSRTAKVVGGTTALGAIVGAIAGGGKGAAIGAASGAAVGGTAQAVTRGQVVKIPSETRLTFTVQQPVQL